MRTPAAVRGGVAGLLEGLSQSEGEAQRPGFVDARVDARGESGRGVEVRVLFGRMRESPPKKRGFPLLGHLAEGAHSARRGACPTLVPHKPRRLGRPWRPRNSRTPC